MGEAANRVHLIDRFVPDAEVPLLLRGSAAMVLPYRHIDQSGALFAARSAGLPVLATDVGSFAQYLEPGRDVLVPACTEDDLARGCRCWCVSWIRKTACNRCRLPSDGPGGHPGALRAGAVRRPSRGWRMTASRRQDIEWLRVLACLGIVWYHARGPGEEFALAGLIVFVMLSVVLAHPREEPLKDRLHARAERLLLPWIFWWGVYAVLDVVTGRAGRWTAAEWPVLLLAGPSIHLWYLPFMFFVLLAMDAWHRCFPGPPRCGPACWGSSPPRPCCCWRRRAC
jgi:hypothetical protein